MTVVQIVDWLKARVCQGARLTLDSRQIREGDVFVALKGAQRDGLDFVDAVRQAGARAVLCEERPDAKLRCRTLPCLEVEELPRRLGEIASVFYGEPSKAMRGIAITGTNGKTSTSHWVAQALTKLHHPCAAIGTIGAFMGGRRFEMPSLTTPDAASLQEVLGEIYAAGGQAFALEASSIGLDQDRMAGTAFEVALFTNLTRDHLSYHKTLENYEAAKARLFEWPGLKAAVINADDAAGRRLIAKTVCRGIRTIAYALEGAEGVATALPEGVELLTAHDIQAPPEGMRFVARWQGVDHPIVTRVLGMFNVSNLLGVAGVLLALGLDAQVVFDRIGLLQAPAGRLQAVHADDFSDAEEPAGQSSLQQSVEPLPLVVVDYAHTPDALEKAICALRPMTQARGGKLWAVFGAGGNRDTGKRPLMGAVAGRLADRVIVTSDNPRNENPELIARAVAQGAESVIRYLSDSPGAAVPATQIEMIVDRREAIRAAVDRADARDVILLAGKGHETYQEVAGVRHHFDDRQEAARALRQRLTKPPAETPSKRPTP